MPPWSHIFKKNNHAFFICLVINKETLFRPWFIINSHLMWLKMKFFITQYWLQDWTDVQCLLGRYGKESLIREVRNADTININSKTSQRVLNMQSKFSLEQIRSVSNGAATFYVWVCFVTIHQISIYIDFKICLVWTIS